MLGAAAQVESTTANDYSATNTQTARTGNSTLDMNAFLTMFVTQLQHQDPTNPLQSYELAAQLAQFSSVERLTEVNKNLEKLQNYMVSLNNAEMVRMIGKEVTGQSDALQLSGGKATKAGYSLEVPAADVSIKIYDEQGQLVRTIPIGEQNSGSYDIKWDGKDDNGKTLADGSYTCKVEALNAEGDKIDVSTTVHGKVYSFLMEHGSQYLVLNGANGIKLPVGNVSEIMLAGAKG